MNKSWKSDFIKIIKAYDMMEREEMGMGASRTTVGV